MLVQDGDARKERVPGRQRLFGFAHFLPNFIADEVNREESIRFVETGRSSQASTVVSP